MLTLLASMTALGGLFLLLWYRTLLTLPLRQRPQFIHPAIFRWGVPALGTLVFILGLLLLASVDLRLPAAALALSALAAFLVVRFDRYSADMRLIHAHYLRINEANPGMEEIEVLYHTAQWRNPGWSHDRLVELIAGKDIESLVLLMVIQENDIHPIADWKLYQSLKKRAARIARPGK